jgi:SAM-dependent methyltransferase
MSPDLCIACGSPSYPDPRTKTLFDFPRLSFPYDPQVRRCRNCGLRWLHPPLTAKQFEQVYREGYFTEAADGFYEVSREDRRRVYRYKRERIRQFSPQARTLLDVGAGEGDFLEICREAFEISGIEMSEHGVKRAHELYGIRLRRGSADDIGDFGHRFDVVHMHHVFEHLLDPRRFLHLLKDCLPPEGIFLFEVPYQFDSLQETIRRLLGVPARPTGLFAVHHPFFYTPASLRSLLDSCGFQILHLDTCPPERSHVMYDSLFKRIFRQALFFGQKLTGRGPAIEVIARPDHTRDHA